MLRSLQVKFSALLVTLLVVACIVLTWLSTQHERRALEAEVERRAQALSRALAGTVKEPLVVRDDLTVGALVNQLATEPGVAAARVLDADGRVMAALSDGEVGELRVPLAGRVEGVGSTLRRAGTRVQVATPIHYSDLRVGESQVELDLAVLVAPKVEEGARQLAGVAVAVAVLGVVSGLMFVSLLVGPIRRLRAGVERLTHGDLTVRVPPTSRDEIGDLTHAFNAMGESLQQKERIQSAFGRYVSDYVVTQLLESPDGTDLAGVEREVTVLFADVRRFTRLSEGMKARDVVTFLNEFFELVASQILTQEGTIDKFIGDSVMAYFGAPIPQSDHAQRAVWAAVQVQRSLAARNRNGSASGATQIGVGIGIHTGAVVVGNIGSERRSDFTAIGDAVNVASRLEKLARPGEILISEAVQRRVRGAVPLRFEGERQLSGRLEPVHVYSVDLLAAGEAPAPAPAKPDPA
ncbi:MAG: adenylate/guanylate cyclase domain-containing protein [Myxococcota bacterium]